MTFNIRQLDTLSYDDVEPILDDYIYDAIDEFANSVAGEAHRKKYPEGGGWIATFIEMAYLYSEKTLPKMTKGDVQEVMEYTLPRKLTLLDPSETDDAIPELVAFWTYLKETYKFRSAGAIVKYLRSIETKFGGWMFDPSRGGIAKNFMMQGMEAGHDMTTPEGVAAFQKEHNGNIKANPPQGTLPFGGSQLSPMVAPPPDLQAMFDLLGVELPEEGTMVNPMDLISNIKNALQSVKDGPSFDDDDDDYIDLTRAYVLGQDVEGEIP